MEVKFKKMLDEVENKDSVLSFKYSSLKVSQFSQLLIKYFIIVHLELHSMKSPLNTICHLMIYIHGLVE